MKGIQTGSLTLMLAGLLMIGGCATTQVTNLVPPPLEHPGPAVHIEDVDMLAVSPGMDAFLERYILPYSNPETRVHLLLESALINGVLNFHYDESLTLTSVEAFEAHSGNCVGFSNMMIALARRAGLNAQYQEIVSVAEWTRSEETVLLVKHVNVFIDTGHNRYVLDVSGIDFKPGARKRTVDDNYAKALYLNNLGANALIENDLPLAYAYMSKAIEAAPMVTDSWVNMGVVFSRNGQEDEAISVFRTALEIDPYQLSAMNNLYEVYVERGDLQAAENLKVRVEKYRRENPYFLMNLSEEALEAGDYEESTRLLKRAIRKKEDDHYLYYALAKTQYLSGQEAASEKSLARARELAPRDKQAYYTRPLGELIAQEKAEQALLVE